MSRPTAEWTRSRLNDRWVFRTAYQTLATAAVGILFYWKTEWELPLPGGKFHIGLFLVMATLALAFYAVFRPYARAERAAMEALGRSQGIAEGWLVRLIVRRGGVFLGEDVGWLGTRDGAMVFEGRRTRFGVTRADLLEPPRSGKLAVWHGSGTVDLEISPYEGQDDGSLARFVEGIPEGETDLPLPPNRVHRCYGVGSDETKLAVVVPSLALLASMILRPCFGIKLDLSWLFGPPLISLLQLLFGQSANSRARELAKVDEAEAKAMATTQTHASPDAKVTVSA